MALEATCRLVLRTVRRQRRNEHIRIHAREGRLFRDVVQEAARAGALPCSIWRERDLYGTAAEGLGQSEQHLRAAVTALGRRVPVPWRAEQKSAALAAWLVLAARARVSIDAGGG